MNIKIYNNSSVELSFLDRRRGKLRITARLFTPDEKPSICYYKNGVKNEVRLGEYTKFGDTLCYIFEIWLESIPTERVEISFDEQVRTGPFFPIEFICNGYFVTDDTIVYSREDVLIFESCTKELLKERQKKYKVLAFNKQSLLAFGIRIMHKLIKPFCKKRAWLISDRLERAGDNGQAFFEYALKNAPRDVLPIFVLDKKSPDYKAMRSLGKVVSPSSPFYKVRYTLADAHISSQLDGSRLLKVRAYLKDILNSQRIIFLQHGIIEHDSSSYYNRFDFGMDMFVTTTKREYDSIVGIKGYGCDDEITELCGLCRYDKLTSERKKIIFICPTWRLGLLTDTESLSIKDGFENSPYFLFYNGLLNNERLLAKATEKGYKICFYPHRMMKNAKKRFVCDSDVIVNGDSFSYAEVFRRGALLVTDYSSVQFDFSYLKKPVIYCQFDKDEFFSSHTCGQGYMDYEQDGFGPVCYDLDSAVDTICRYLDADCVQPEKYGERVDKTFKFTDKQNCERTLKKILEIDNA